MHQWFSNSVKSMFTYSFCRWFKCIMYLNLENREVICNKLNNDMDNIMQWLCCNKILWDVSKTNHILFTPRNKQVENLNIKIRNMIDAQLSWKCHMRYICEKISKCLGAILTAREKWKFCRTYIVRLRIHISFTVIMSGAIHILLISIKLLCCRKKMIKIAACSSFRAHS